ncbi:uncharacterized protein MKK02DRAFT_39278 [Dioszegia hungarica]|uniref:Glutaredoxin domain-containing protein n=1 Tax=Dioszegia hungarica TaxID=4972 RepID=A0AA38LTG2_9TREE|nr:uncharacterized protein MKK02DRAFT_39278 [Dioszegia hungarica]KAI9633299.1 hypothetical protein MKK02DRAFT_39278 [Dioszegia hungarica]
MSAPIPSFPCSPSSSSSNQRRTLHSSGSPSKASSSSSSSRLRTYLPDRTSRSPDPDDRMNRSPRFPEPVQFDPTLAIPDYAHHASAYIPSDTAHPLSKPPLQKRSSSLSVPRNIPSRPLSRDGAAIPKPLVRLILILVTMAAGALLLVRTTAPRIPLFRVNVRREFKEAGGYEPPQVGSTRMLQKASAPRSARTPLTFVPHPIPFSHELLALQSYLLQSSHNALPPNINPSKPLDGNAILSISPAKLGRPGSANEAAWLRELEHEREEDIVIWAPAASGVEVEGMYEVLGKLHHNAKSPSLIQLQDRSDGEVLEKIMTRLGVEVKKPLMMLGNKRVVGGLTELKRMMKAGELETELERIGWLDAKKVKEMKEKVYEVVKPFAVKGDKGEAAAEGKPGADAEAVEEDGGDGPRIMNAAFKQ